MCAGSFKENSKKKHMNKLHREKNRKRQIVRRNLEIVENFSLHEKEQNIVKHGHATLQNKPEKDNCLAFVF